MAAETETLTITLPTELLQSIRARVLTGRYSSDNDLILHDLQEAATWDALPAESLGSLDDIFAEIPAQIARIESGEEQLHPHEEAVARLDAMRQEYLAR